MQLERDSLMDVGKRLGDVYKRVIEQLLRSDSSCMTAPIRSTPRKKIDMQIEEDSRKSRKECKVLLLVNRAPPPPPPRSPPGSGKSGKSTIRLTVYRNLLESAQAIVLATCKLSVAPVLPADAILDYKLNSSGAGVDGAVAAFSEDVVGTISALWADLIVPCIMDHSSEFYLMDCALYIFSEVGRVGSTGYVPTETDVLRARRDALQHEPAQHTHVRRRRPALQSARSGCTATPSLLTEWATVLVLPNGTRTDDSSPVALDA
ncbi:hypothetical protein DFH11DRAFT_1729468 [Phellopilus nigrolimitatus]|nr:hypothetical protein DFH11DRAFT_1729468 [Phellopilus nigrolimitatus]